MAFDVKKLRLGEQIAAGAAILLFISMFLKWYGVKVPAGARSFLSAAGVSPDVNAWKAFGGIDLYLLVVILITLGFVVLTATQRAPALPVAGSVIVTVLGGLAAILILYRIINQPGPNNLVDVKIGAYIGLVLALVLTYGGFRAMREEGTSFSHARAQAEAMVSQQRTGTTPPPAGTTPPPTTEQPVPGAPPAGTPPAGGSTPPPATSSPPPAPGTPPASPPPPPAQNDPPPPGGTGV